MGRGNHDQLRDLYRTELTWLLAFDGIEPHLTTGIGSAASTGSC